MTSTRLALVTGTTSGIGEVVARKLLASGWHVVGIARRDAAVEHERYTHVALDLADLETLPTRVAREVRPLVESPHVARLCLVNCAADPAIIGPVERVDPVSAQRAYAVNVIAPVWLMGWVVRATGPQVPVRIVNVSSGAGVMPFRGLATYGGTKAALRMAGMVFAEELDAEGARDVTIVSFSPGRVDTPMQELARGSDRETFPLVELFTRWHADGELIAPEVPAEQIVRYVETDGHPRFVEVRPGEIPEGR